MNDATMELPEPVVDRTVHHLVMPSAADLDGDATFTVHRGPVAPGADVEELGEQSARAAARRLPGFRFVAETRREIDGLPALDVCFTWTRADEEVYERRAHVVVRDTWLVFSASAGLDARDVCDAAIERAIKTFRVRRD